MVALRTATASDFATLYALGKATPEFKVGATGEFMESDEFLSAITSPHSVFLLAEADGAIVGFIYVNTQDIERGLKTQWACLVYLVVSPMYRKQGVAKQLYDAAVMELKAFGVTALYTWANTESDGSIISFMEKQGFATGHTYRWMDKKI